MTSQSSHTIIADLFASERIENVLADSLVQAYTGIAQQIADRTRKQAPLVVGICGSQGSGKSTLALVLQRLLTAGGLPTAQFSLDDLYTPLADRKSMADTIHPLLRTRGVPGTHDVPLGLETLRALKKAGTEAITAIPSFDKAADDRVPKRDWPCVQGRPAVILFEGWCVGARPQAESALIEPVNALEREEDPDLTWRRFVNARLGDEYQKLFAELDMLLLLQAPSFETVFAWRKQQEIKLRESMRLKGYDANLTHVMDDDQLDRFIRHYERLTRHILKEMPGRADICVSVDADRTMKNIVMKND